METLLFAVYILIWPLLSLGVLAVIFVATMRDIQAARRENRELV